MRRLVPLLLVSTLFSSFAAAQNMPLNRGRWTQVEDRMISYPSTATMLADGRVFIAGAANRTYLFDPATNRLTLGPFDHFSRGSLTATRLADGRVLLAGGNGDDPTCTIFDPATNRITATAPLLQARSSHTATLLPNGKVLVAGGYRLFTGMTTCEIFDPATGTWAEAGPLKVARNNHTATLLPNGRILFAGGDDGNATTFSAELYDPATMTSAVIGTFPGQRRQHAAVTVPDGRVYLLGAFFDEASDETAVDIYDPATNTLTPVAMRIFAPQSRTAGLLQDGRILIAGNVPGVTFPDWSTTPYQPRCVLLDPISGKATIANATQKNHGAAVVLPDGRMLLLGGQVEPATDETMAELFDPNAPRPRGDYTRDGTSDILWYQPSTRRKVVWRMNGLAAAASGIAPMRECLGSPNHLAAALDVDGGGRMDGLFFDGYNLTYALDLLPSRCGEVCGAMLADSSVAATADFDGDGRDDVLLRRANGEVAMSLMTRPGEGPTTPCPGRF